ncbi:MAG: pilus assembly protein PilM [Sedimentisphaerales bacterium]
MLFNIFAESIFPIGVEITPGFVRMAQLGRDGGQITLIAGGGQSLPQGLEPYSGRWQRCVIDVVKSIYSSAPFKSKKAVTIIPSTDVLSKEIRKNLDKKDSEEIINTEARKLLPANSHGAIVKYIVLNQDSDLADEKDVLILAAEKYKVERHLAIFEKAGLDATAVTVWPVVLVNCYTNFFARRKTDVDSVVLLINAAATGCNAVICRQNDILFARAIPYGIDNLNESNDAEKPASEIEACIRYFQNTIRTATVERIILLANEGIDSRLVRCVLNVAKKYALPAHIGDTLAAVAANQDTYKRGIDSRGPKNDWTTVFGLSLSEYLAPAGVVAAGLNQECQYE